MHINKPKKLKFAFTVGTIPYMLELAPHRLRLKFKHVVLNESEN